MDERPEAALAAAECILQALAHSDVPTISRVGERKSALRVADCFVEELFSGMHQRVTATRFPAIAFA
jgi:hypothetical protein